MSTQPLAGYVRAQAEWRERKVEKYPDDPRNSQSAAALHALADFIDGDGGEQEDALALLPYLSDDGQQLGGERTQRAVSRYGYGHGVSTGSHEAFLEKLLALCLRDTYEDLAQSDSNYDPTGTLYHFEIAAALDGIVLNGGYWMRRAQAQLSVEDLEDWVDEVRGADREEEAEDITVVHATTVSFSSRSVSLTISFGQHHDETNDETFDHEGEIEEQHEIKEARKLEEEERERQEEEAEEEREREEEERELEEEEEESRGQ